MKNYLLTIIALLMTAISASAQQPAKQQWNVYVTPTSDIIPRCTMIYYSDNRFGTYAGHTYRLLYGQSDIIDDDPIGMYREDNGKVFMRELVNMTPSEEYLIYDWSLNVGDTAYVQPGNSNTGLVLDAETDTVVNGFQRRVFHLHYETNADLTEIWIEGMGSELGFPFSGTKNNPVSFNYYPMTTEMLCYYEDDELSWDNPDFDECVIDGVLDVNEHDFCHDLSVYPNPVFEIVNIAFSDDIGCQSIEIYSVDGRIVETYGRASLQTAIDISNLNSGVYILKVNMADGREFTERIVKL